MILKKELIYDDGKIRDCIQNRYYLGYIGNLIHICNYYETIKRIDIFEYIRALSRIIEFILMIVIFPIIPFIRAFVIYNEAKKEMKEHGLIK